MTFLRRLFSEPLPVGTPAPDFELPDESGSGVQLSSLRGKNVVLVFYPGDDTPTCRKQLCEFRDDWAQLRARNIEVFGVNPRGGTSHSRFRQKFGFPFPLLVDRGQRVAALYQADAGIVVKRTVYLIGPDGTVRYGKRGKPLPEEVMAAAR